MTACSSLHKSHIGYFQKHQTIENQQFVKQAWIRVYNGAEGRKLLDPQQYQDAQRRGTGKAVLLLHHDLGLIRWA